MLLTSPLNFECLNNNFDRDYKNFINLFIIQVTEKLI